jgi:hypothetical protein
MINLSLKGNSKKRSMRYPRSMRKSSQGVRMKLNQRKKNLNKCLTNSVRWRMNKRMMGRRRY